MNPSSQSSLKSLDSLRDVNVFVQVAELRSFAQTGRVTGVSASAVGKRIARLEQRLEVRLFHRSTRSIALTAEGAMFLLRCRKVIAELQQAERELTESAATPQGRLRVGLPLAGSLLLPILADFMAAYPEVALHLDLCDRLVNVIEEGYDAVIRTGEPESSGLSTRRLGSFPMMLVASPEYLARRGMPATPPDLAAHACLHYCYLNTGKLEKWPLRWPAGSGEIALPVSMVCNTLEARVCFAEKGVGIACLPEFAARAGLARGTLRQLLAEHTRDDVCSTFRIFWPSHTSMPSRLRVFIDFLGQHAAMEKPGRRAEGRSGSES